MNGPNTSRLVLIVEDSETCAETLQIALESVPGLEIRVMRSAVAAIETLHSADSDVAALVTDLNMQSFSGSTPDGFELIRKLRADPRFAHLPILLISGDSDPRLPVRALEWGADAFFAKPYSPAAVRRKLEQLICSQG